MKAMFIVVYEYAGCDMHGVDKTEAFTDAAIFESFLNLGSYIYETYPFGDMEN